ncbi:ATP-binding protein, partial [Rhodosalinus sp.]|uniref:hybrid sensor histidine kinase/response regulator n=1 Tax=Rhodosalinus sp. TaxID=2047741 RepID=UPI00397CBC1F
DERLAAGWPVVRDASLSALMQLLAEAEKARGEEQRILTTYIGISLGLLAMMLVAAVLSSKLWVDLLRQARASRRTAEMLERVLERSTDAIVLTDTSGQVRRVNTAASELFGGDIAAFARTEAGQGDGQGDPRAVDIGRFLADPFADRIGGGRYRSEALVADGRAVPVDISVVAAPHAAGQRFLVFFLHDMAREDAVERELRRARDTAEAHAAAKNRFLTAVSHEMRTPLHGLLAALDLLRAESEGRDDGARMLGIAEESARRLQALVEDMLYLARADEVVAAATRFCPARTAARVVEDLSPLAAGRGTAIRLDTAGDPPAGVCLGSAAAFSSVLRKLVANALEHSRAQQVTVTLGFAQRDEESLHLTVDVCDEGPCIAPGSNARSFDPFETETPGAPRAGTGLDLAVARSLVRAWGGAIEVESTPGGGTCFRFSLDLKTLADADPAAPRALPVRRPRRGGRALVADDNAVNVTLMRHMAERVGFPTEEAVNGRQAVALAARRRFALIVLDHLMPEMTGLDAARRIRAGGASRAAMILLVTAVPEQISPEAATSAGVDAVLPKPMGIASLMRVLDAPEPGVAPPAVAAQDSGDSFDFAELCEMLDPETAQALVAEALSDARRAVAALRDPVPVERRIDAVHHAAGSTSMIGFHALGEAMKQAQRALQDGKTPAVDRLQGLLARAEQRVARSRVTSANARPEAG